MKRNYSGLVYANSFKTIAQTLALFIIAHYLGPESFGEAAIVFAILNYISVSRDINGTNLLIINKKINRSDLLAAFNVNLATTILSILIAGAFIFMFKVNINIPALLLALFLYFIGSFGNIAISIYERYGKFKNIIKIELASSMVSILIGIYLSYKGFGVYSIIFYSLLPSVLITILSINQTKKSFSGRYSLKLIIKFINHGKYILANTSVNYFYRNADILLISMNLGVNTAGIYALMMKLVANLSSIISSSINRQLFPNLTKENDKLKNKNDILYGIKIISLLIAPIVYFLYYKGDYYIGLIFGEKWLEAANNLKYIIFVSYFQALDMMTGSIFMAKNRMRPYFYWNILVALSCIVVFYIGSIYSLKIFCILYTLYSMVIYMASIKNNYIYYEINFKDIFLNVFRSNFTALISTLILILYNLNSFDEDINFIVWPILFFGTYLLANYKEIMRFGFGEK